MQLFGVLHLSLLAAIVALCVILPVVVRKGWIGARPIRLFLGWGLAVNELGWWAFRYSNEGWRFPHNMPLQLCDVTIWMTAIACITLWRPSVEFAWFGGMAGAGMALLTPDLWSPWPSYPAIYFFIAHGGIVIGIATVVAGGIRLLEPGAVWRAFGVLIAYASAVGVFNAIFGTNYMYLCQKPGSASLLDQLGPWPMYLVAGAAVALVLFWMLWLPMRPAATASATSRQ
jgi:hypothetical integral membrane protein (TIGR02206 family)